MNIAVVHYPVVERVCIYHEYCSGTPFCKKMLDEISDAPKLISKYTHSLHGTEALWQISNSYKEYWL